MRNGRSRVEEQLLLAAEMPVLSGGLRARVLTAAVETRRRRTYGRSTLRATGLLMACLGAMAWHRPLALVHETFADAVALTSEDAYAVPAPLLNVSRRYGRGELLLAAAGDEWRMVEAEMQSRREGSRHIRASF